jgi:hypothetical protein
MRCAHPQNVAGPFYVEDGCCLTCTVPFEAAPGLFSWNEAHDHCFVSRQPSTDDEVRQMLEAVANSGEACIRYRGDAPEVVRALARRGDAHLWDPPLPASGDPVHAVLELGAPIAGRSFARPLAHRCCVVQSLLRVRAEDHAPFATTWTTVERWASGAWEPAFELGSELGGGVGRLHVRVQPGWGTLTEAAAVVLAALQDHGGFPEARWAEVVGPLEPELRLAGEPVGRLLDGVPWLPGEVRLDPVLGRGHDRLAEALDRGVAVPCLATQDGWTWVLRVATGRRPGTLTVREATMATHEDPRTAAIVEAAAIVVDVLALDAGRQATPDDRGPLEGRLESLAARVDPGDREARRLLREAATLLDRIGSRTPGGRG